MQKKNIYNIKVGYLQTNCWIIPLEPEKNISARIPRGSSACAIIDPGDEAGRIIAMLDQYKLYPLYIILTHGHFDHIGAVPSLAAEYEKRYAESQGGYDKPLIAIHREEAASPLGIPPFPMSPLEALKNKPEPDIYLCEGDKINSFTVLHLPGHSPGSIGLLDEQAGILFSGDTLFCDGYGRTDLPGGNTDQLFSSLKRLFALNGSIKVYPGHDETTTIGAEAARGHLTV